MTGMPDGGIRITGAPTDRARLRVGFLLLRDFTLLPFAGFVDVLRLAADEGDQSRQIESRWTIMTADGQPVRASCGTRITPDSGLIGPRGFDYVVVVGGLIHQGPVQDPAVHAWLRAADSAGVHLVGLCTAVFTLIDAGLMRDRQCCVSWYHYWDLVKAFPDVTPGRRPPVRGGRPAHHLRRRHRRGRSGGLAGGPPHWHRRRAQGAAHPGQRRRPTGRDAATHGRCHRRRAGP